MEQRLEFIERKLKLLGVESPDDLHPPLDELLADPARLLALAEKALMARDWEKGYRLAVVAHVLHPDHELDKQALLLAKTGLIPGYNNERLMHEAGRWSGRERRFLYAWMRERIARADFDPAEFELYFGGMNARFFQDFFGADGKVQRVAGWQVTAVTDNGYIDEVLVERLPSDRLIEPAP